MKSMMSYCYYSDYSFSINDSLVIPTMNSYQINAYDNEHFIGCTFAFNLSIYKSHQQIKMLQNFQSSLIFLILPFSIIMKKVTNLLAIKQQYYRFTLLQNPIQFSQSINFYIQQSKDNLILNTINILPFTTKIYKDSFLFQLIAKILLLAYQLSMTFNIFTSPIKNILQNIYRLKMSLSREQIKQIIKKFMEKIKLEDLINIAFMRPFDAVLRTHQTQQKMIQNKTSHQQSPKPNNKKKGDLPQGLLQAKKLNISDNGYRLTPIPSIPLTQNQTNQLKQLKLQSIRNYNQDNYISLLKKPQGTQIGICVCMFNEGKKMLKRTLIGIAENIDKMIDRGISPDDVFVTVMVDGIQKLDESVINYFQELERESQIFLENQNNTDFLYGEFEEYQQNMEGNGKTNISRILFNQLQFQDRLQRRVKNVIAMYKQNLSTIKKLQTLKQDTTQNQSFKLFIQQMMKQQAATLKAFSLVHSDINLQQTKFTQQQIINDFVESQEDAKKYISSRQELSYIVPFRVPIKSLVKYDEQTQNNQYERRMKEQFSLRFERLLRGRKDQESTNDQNSIMETENEYTKYVNLFFCIKYQNSGKLSSHNWFFNGFCNQLKPRYSMLLDVGLRPYPQAIFKMHNYLKSHKKVGGVCGYMSLKVEKVEDQEMHQEQQLDWLSNILTNIFDIQKAQQIEYHFAHLIDKPFESTFKFIHVLPGAFSGYNMEALRPKKKKDILLKEYFRSMGDKIANNRILQTNFSALQLLLRLIIPKALWKKFRPIHPDSEEQLLYNENISLAQDRNLCMGIHKNEYEIVFMPDAYAEVDPIKSLNALMGQRKRWINGSMYAFDKVQRQIEDANNSSMAVIDFFLKLQILYLNFTNFLVYFAPALMLFTFHLTMTAVKEKYLVAIFKNSGGGLQQHIYTNFVNLMDLMFIAILFATVIFSIHLTHTNKRFIYYIYLFSTILGIIYFVTIIFFIVDIIEGFLGRNSYFQKQYIDKMKNQVPVISQLITVLQTIVMISMGIYIVPCILYGVLYCRIAYLWEIITGVLSFLFYSPSYLNLLNIYAMSRIDDVSWGTKGFDQAQQGHSQHLKKTWKTLKIINIGKYLLWNLTIGGVLIFIDGNTVVKFFVVLSLLMIVSFVLVIKVIVGSIYLIKYRCCESNNQNDNDNDIQDDFYRTRLHIFRVLQYLSGDINKSIDENIQRIIEQMNTESTRSSRPALQSPYSISQQHFNLVSNDRSTPSRADKITQRIYQYALRGNHSYRNINNIQDIILQKNPQIQRALKYQTVNNLRRQRTQLFLNNPIIQQEQYPRQYATRPLYGYHSKRNNQRDYTTFNFPTEAQERNSFRVPRNNL